jgi:integrase
MATEATPPSIEDGEVPHSIEQEILDFYDWFSDKTDSTDTLEDYTAYVKGFYVKTHGRTGIEHPVQLETDQDLNQVKSQMKRYIGSRATEYGLRKYLDYLQDMRGIQETRNAKLLDDMLQGVGKKNQNRSRKEKIGAKVRSREKIETIIETAPDHTNTLDEDELELFLRVMYETAGRVGDVQRLLWGDVDRENLHGNELDQNEIVIDAQRSKSKESGSVRLSDETMQRLREHRKKDEIDDGPDQFVFFQDRESKDKNYRRIRRSFRSGGKEAGIPINSDEDFGTHNFRHSRLTHLGRQMLEDEERDLNYSTVRERLRSYGRHKNVDDTEVYIELLKEKYQIDISKYD